MKLRKFWSEAGGAPLHALLILTYTSKNQVVHEQKLKDPLSSTCQINPERRVLDLESKVNKRPAFKSH